MSVLDIDQIREESVTCAGAGSVIGLSISYCTYDLSYHDVYRMCTTDHTYDSVSHMYDATYCVTYIRHFINLS